VSQLRILLLGPDCDPETVSIPLVTFHHAAALAKLHDVTLVARSSVEDALLRAKTPFCSIEVVRTPLLDRIFAWGFRRIFKCNYDSQALTAFRYPFSVAFEWRAWRQLRRRIFAGEFDVVLRLVPMSPVLPSPFAVLLRNGPIPFVIGPLNGGLPWPPGFSQLDNQRQWISGFEGSVPVCAFRPVHLSPRGSNHRRFVTDVCRVCRISRQAVFCPRARHRPLALLRRLAEDGTRRQTRIDFRWWTGSPEGL
jgi:hypothetical protein